MSSSVDNVMLELMLMCGNNVFGNFWSLHTLFVWPYFVSDVVLSLFDISYIASLINSCVVFSCALVFLLCMRNKPLRHTSIVLFIDTIEHCNVFEFWSLMNKAFSF